MSGLPQKLALAARVSGIFVAPVQKGIAKVVGLVLVAPRHPFQVKVELNIGDHGKSVHLSASVEEVCILRNVENHVAVALNGKQSSPDMRANVSMKVLCSRVSTPSTSSTSGRTWRWRRFLKHASLTSSGCWLKVSIVAFSTVFCKNLNYL